MVRTVQQCNHNVKIELYICILPLIFPKVRALTGLIIKTVPAALDWG